MAEPTPATSGATVTVACKHPLGLILRIGDREEITEELLGGGKRTTTRWRPRPQTVQIHGTAHEPGKYPRSGPLVNGYALTHGVPKDFFEQWLKDNKDNPLVENRIVYAHQKAGEAKVMTRETRDVRSGMEPMAQKDDPRTPRPSNGAVSSVETMTANE